MIWELERLLEWVQDEGDKKDIEDFITRLKIQNQKLKHTEQVIEFDLSIEWKLIARNALTRERLWSQLAWDIDRLIYLFTHNRNAYFDQIRHIQQMQNKIRTEKQGEKKYWRKAFLENIDGLLKVNLETISLKSGIIIEWLSRTIESSPRVQKKSYPDWNTNNISIWLEKSIQDELLFVMKFVDDPNELIHNKSMMLLWLENKLKPLYDRNEDPNMQWEVGSALRMVREKEEWLQRSAIDDAQLATLKIENRPPTISPKEFDALRFIRIEKQWKLYLWKLQYLLSASPVARKKLSDHFLGKTLSERLSLELTSIFPEVEVGSELRKYLAIDSIPEEEIIWKLSKSFRIKDSMNILLDNLASAQQFYPEEFQKILTNGYRHIWVTSEELYILIQRYRFAREVKILAIMDSVKRLWNESKIWELIQLENWLEYQISSSVKQEELKGLLDPTFWKNRTLIKDRVHLVDIWGKLYIMKEWKSPKHTDHATWDKDPISSYSEFMMAEELYQKWSLKLWDFSVSVERPIVYIKTPDGYSFVLFEAVRSPDPYVYIDQIRSHIQEYQDSYRDEFAELNKRLKWEWSHEVSFDDYIEIKVNTLDLLKRELGGLYQELHWFENWDMGQFFIWFNDNWWRLGIEMTMFDLEFSHKTSHSQKYLIDLNWSDKFWKFFLPVARRSDLEDALRIMLSFATTSIRSEMSKILQ